MVFNHPLVDGIIDTANWFIRFANTIRLIDSAIVAGDTVILVTSTEFADLGPDVVSYFPPPFDLMSDFGFVPAAEFNDFPLM